MRRVSFVVFLLCVAGAMGPRADTEIGSEGFPAELSDSIVVTANRSETPLREIASSITVVTAEQIALAQDRMVIDVLRKVPGLDVVQSGGTGQITSVFLRGAKPHHTLVVIDGVEMNDPSTPNGTFDMSNLSVENIERIEILRGPQSVLYGSDAIGGIIQVFTRRGGRRPRITGTSEAGAFKTYRESLALSGSANRLDYSAALSRLDTDGISATGGRSGSLERDGYDNTTLSASLGFMASRSIDLRFSGRLTESDTDLDRGFGILDDPNYVLNGKERSAAVRLIHDSHGGFWSHQAGLSITDYERSTRDRNDAAHPSDAEATRYEGSRIKVDWQHLLNLSQTNELMLGVEAETEEFSQDLFFRSALGDYESALSKIDAQTYGLFALEKISIMGRWFSTIGVRLDNHEQFGTVGTYRVTTALWFDALNLKIRGAIGTGFKAPSLYQLYDSTFGNPALQPERSRGWEIGFESGLSGGRLGFGAAYFDNSYKELIASLNIGAVNIARATSDGAEIFGSFRTGNLSLRLDYTYTWSWDKMENKPLIRLPVHKASLTVLYRPVETLGLNITARYVDERDDLHFQPWPKPVVTVSLADYAIADLTAAWDVSDHLQLFGRINNAFDGDYVEVFTYGTAPRAGYLGLKAMF